MLPSVVCFLYVIIFFYDVRRQWDATWCWAPRRLRTSVVFVEATAAVVPAHLTSGTSDRRDPAQLRVAEVRTSEERKKMWILFKHYAVGLDLFTKGI